MKVVVSLTLGGGWPEVCWWGRFRPPALPGWWLSRAGGGVVGGGGGGGGSIVMSLPSVVMGNRSVTRMLLMLLVG